MELAVRLAKTWVEAIGEVTDELAEADQSQVEPEEFHRRVYARVCEKQAVAAPTGVMHKRHALYIDAPEPLANSDRE